MWGKDVDAAMVVVAPWVPEGFVAVALAVCSFHWILQLFRQQDAYKNWKDDDCDDEEHDRFRPSDRFVVWLFCVFHFFIGGSWLIFYGNDIGLGTKSYMTPFFSRCKVSISF